jgi:IclR family transcriptional regulator, KDG regulon repressor
MVAKDEVRALSRGLQLLEILVSKPEGMSLTHVAHEMDLAKSSVHRLLQTLVHNGYVCQKTNQNNRHYYASFKLLTLSNKLVEDVSLSEISQPHLEQLAHASGETVHLVLWDQSNVVYIEKVEAPNPIRMYSRIGNHAPLHCTGVGKAVFAFLPEEQRERLLQQNFTRYTDNTLIDPDALRQNFEQIRVQGYAVDDGEHEEHVLCIAVPLFTRDNKVAGAISIAAVSYRMELAKLLALQPMLSEHAQQLSIELAHFFDRRI